MAENENGLTQPEVKVARARPVTGVILGLLIGLAIAVILQQHGIWPLDKITVFLLPALIGLIAILITSVGRTAAPAAMTIALVFALALGVWGATGLSTINEQGQLNGGCEVVAFSDVDDTDVKDTSKRDPFVIDPNGGLSWVATSPTVFDDYPWKIWVEFGGAQITLDSEENQDNDGGSQINDGDVSNIQEYGESRGIPVSEMRGVYKVGGDAANTCDGFGFVKLLSDPFETLVSQIALGVAILLLIILLLVALTGRKRPVEVPVGPDGIDGNLSDDAGAAGVAGAAGAAAAAEGDEGEGDDEGGIAEDIAEGAVAAGFGVDGEDPVEFEEGADPADED